MSAPSSQIAREPSSPEMPPNVLFSGQVKKIGFDGSSLPRLVVVTDHVLYVCLLSGGITRSISMEKVEYLSISTTGDGSGQDHDVSAEPDDGTVDASSPQSVISSSSKRAGSSGGGATPEKIAERIRKRFQRKKTKESAIKARGAAGTASGAAHTPPADISMIIATIGVVGEVALVLRFHTDDEAVDFAAAMEHIAEVSQTPIRFHLPAEMSARTSAITSRAHSTTISPTRHSSQVRDDEAEEGEDDDKVVEKRVVEAGALVPEVVDVVDTQSEGEPAEATATATPPPPPPPSSAVDERLQRWRQRADGVQPEKTALPSRSYFSAAIFGTRPVPSTEADTAQAAAAAAAVPPAGARESSPSLSPDSASLPTSSDSTSAPPSPVPGRRASSPRWSEEREAPHTATITAALSAARRSEDARRAEAERSAILEPLVHSTTTPAATVVKAEVERPGVDDSAAYELELSPEAPPPPPPPSQETREAREQQRPSSSARTAASQNPSSAATESRRVNPAVNRGSPDTAEDDGAESAPGASVYHQLYGAPVPHRATSHRSHSRDQPKLQTVSESLPHEEDEERHQDPYPRSDARPRPVSGLNESHHQPPRTASEPRSQWRHSPTRSTIAAAASAVPISFRTPAPASVPEVSRLLRIDEGLAEEMLAAREDARVAEAARQEAEERLHARDSAVRALQQALQVAQDKHDKALAKQAHKHSAELRGVQEAFEAYDQRMSAFLDKLQSEHESDAAKWLAERRELRAVLREKDAELARLAQLLTEALAHNQRAPDVSAAVVAATAAATAAAPASRPKKASRAPAAAPPPPQQQQQQQPQSRRDWPAYLDTVRGRAGVDEDAFVVPTAPADYYEEAHDRLQTKLAKYTRLAQGKSPTTSRVTAQRAPRREAEPYDVDENMVDVLPPPPPQRTVKTPLVRSGSQVRQAAGRPPSSLTAPSSSSMRRATTRILQYPNDDDDGHADEVVEEGGRFSRQPGRLMSPSRE